MGEKYIPITSASLKGKETDYVMEVMRKSHISTSGTYTPEFEEKAARYIGVPQAAAVHSGTAAMHLALLVLGVRKGEEVIVPTLTDIQTVNPVRYVGAEPIFMDCDEMMTLDPIKLRDFCEDECDFDGDILTHRENGKRIRAVIVSHVFGNLADMNKISEICEKYRLRIIEDASSALGSKYREGRYAGRFEGKFAGAMGSVGIFSLDGDRIITTGNGGLLVSNDAKLVERARFLSSQAKADIVHGVYEEIGYNYRMTNLAAAVGLGQLEQVEDFVAIKERNYEAYKAAGLALRPFRDYTRANHWYYSYETEYRDELISHLEEHHIQARPIPNLIHTLRPYEGNANYRIGNAARFHNRVVNIPCSVDITHDDILHIAELIQEFEASQD